MDDMNEAEREKYERLSNDTLYGQLLVLRQSVIDAWKLTLFYKFSVWLVEKLSNMLKVR